MIRIIMMIDSGILNVILTVLAFCQWQSAHVSGREMSEEHAHNHVAYTHTQSSTGPYAYTAALPNPDFAEAST